MKKILSIFLAILMTFGSVAVALGGQPLVTAEAAGNVLTEGNFKYMVTDGEATLVDYTDNESTDEITVPETLGGYPVTVIGEDSFVSCDCTAIYLPKTVKKVQPYAFNCFTSNLKNIYVDDANEYYTDYEGALYTKDMTELTAFPIASSNIIFPETVRVIAPYAFNGLKNGVNLTIPGHIEEIGYSAFGNCRKLENLTIKEGVKKIDSYAFIGCEYLEKVNIPESVEYIGAGIFQSCRNLGGYDLKGVRYIDGCLIDAKSSFDKEYYEIEEGTRIVAGEIWFDNTTLKEVYIPSTVEHIEVNPFNMCHNLEKITVSEGNPYFFTDENGVLCGDGGKTIISYPSGRYGTCFVVEEGVERIAAQFFYDGPYKCLYIPKSVKYIDTTGLGVKYGADTFDSITDIYYEGTEEEWRQIEIVPCIDTCGLSYICAAELAADIHYSSYSTAQHGIVTKTETNALCSCGYEAEFEQTNYDGDWIASDGWAYVIDENGNAVIKSYGYKDSTDALVIPETVDGYTVTTLDRCAFANCMFSSVHIPATVTEIHEEAFAYALNNQAFSVAEGNEEFSATADGVLLGVMDYAIYAYPQNAPATEYKTPKQVCGIAPFAFCGAKNLKTVTMPSYKYAGQTLYTVGMIFDYAFLNSSVESVYIEGEEFQWMGNGAFKNSQLKEITFPSISNNFGISKFGYDVFEGTPFLENADYDEDGVFYYQDYLIATKEGAGKAHYDVKDGTTVIAGGAFKWSELEEVYIPASVKYIGGNPFVDCPNYQKTTVSSESKNLSNDEYGVLFNKDKTTMIAYPTGRLDLCYAIPSGVTHINDRAIMNKFIRNIHVPVTVTAMEEYPFGHAFTSIWDYPEIFYEGTVDQWKEIEISDGYPLNYSCLAQTALKNYGKYTAVHTVKKTEHAPTCEVDGYVEAVCSCGVTNSFDHIDAPGHDVESWNVTREPTCTSRGYKEGVCTVCGETVGKFISILRHDYVETSRTEASCVEDGVINYECTRCGGEKHTTIKDASGHAQSNEVIKLDPTCTKGGGAYYKCANCGEPAFEIITTPAKGHTEGEWHTEVEPTCTMTGLEILTCTDCGEELESKTLPKTGHSYTEEITHQSCTQITTKYTCTKCAYSYSKDITGTGSHITKDVVVDPTCTESGKRYSVCISCDSVIGSVLTLPATGHTFGEYVYSGESVFSGTCSECGEIIEELPVEITLDNTELMISSASKVKIFATVTQNITDDIVFTSSDDSVATVDNNGNIEAHKAGKAVITARINGTDITATCDLTVYANTYDTQWVVDGEIKVIIPVKAGSAIAAPDDPVKDGYVFAGWSPAIPDEMPAMPLQFTAVFNKFSKSEDYDVSATFLPEAFSEEVSLNVTEITADREPGGVYMVEGEYYKQIGLYNIKALNAASAVVQPNEGYTVTIKMAIPDAYKNRADFMVYHRFTGGGREQLSTENGTLRVENGYLIFVVSQFSEFEIFVPTASMKISHLPDKTSYFYGEDIDLTGIRLRYTKADGTTKSITDASAMTVSGYDSTKTGKQTVTVRYGQYTDTFEVTVSYSLWQWIIRILFLGFLWY
ncbi:MAG: leucine-rich repeat protein [Clostridia bacterium]|nr:leucine-rich repeat protein [Clostridia bacterium]